MTRLRTLAGTALVAGIFAGLAGCGTHKGDLGAESHPSAPVVKSEENKSAEGTAAAESTAPADAKPVEVATTEGAAPAPAAVAPVAEGRTKADERPNETPPAPAPVPVPAPMPVEETPEERANRLLREADKRRSIQEQATVQSSRSAYETGLKLFNDLEYEEARRYFEQAVALDPANQEAQQKLRVVNALLGIKVDKMYQKIRELEQAERVKIQESVVALAQAIEEARDLEDRGSQTVLETTQEGKERALSDQLDSLRRAQDRYRRVREILNWMPPNFELPGQRAQVEQALTRLRQKIADKEDQISFLRRMEATKRAEEQRVRETELFKQRICKLLEQVKDLYDRQDYVAAERLAIRVLQMDPLNSAAEGWKNKARSAYHSHEVASTRDTMRDEMKRSWEDVEEASISYAPLIVYPSNWDQISRRAEGSAIGRQVREETWKSDIRKRLLRKVTFEFVDTPLPDAIEFLRGLAGVTMIVDPKVLAGGAPSINLRVTDMSLDLALEWILKLAELEYALKDSAIFISKPANLQEAVELRIYDVSDLTATIPDFPGPEFQITVAADQSAGGGAGGNPFVKAPTVVPTLTNIADMIRNRVRPESWDPNLGTSIEERGGRLVVMQRPEIHALVDQLLSNFRATQKMMINIESRFLTVREAYLEEVGVEFQGLDPNVLMGDFGDIRRLGAPNNFQQPRVAGSTDGTPPNAPFPGFVNGPDRVLGGSFSEVGSIVNHTINFFSNDPDTISGAEGGKNIVTNGGLSAQVSVLNNAQVQAFIRALAVRENTSTLIAPRLTVFNTQRAHMFVARQQSYVADYEISGDSYDPVIRQFLVGVVLDVKPIVSSDRRYVTLELRPTVTELVSFVTRQIDSFQIHTTANVVFIIALSFPIQFPELAIRRVRTTATVPDGGILLVGGLYRNIKFTAENGVPFLSDLPVVGRLFRWNTVDNARSNLAILVSPRIILFNEEEEKL